MYSSLIQIIQLNAFSIIQYCIPITTIFYQFHLPERNTNTLSVTSYFFYLPLTYVITNLFSIFIDLSLLNIAYK